MEICVDNLASAHNALDGGASRLELCSSLNDGGLTPSLGLTKAVVVMAKAKGAKVHVLLRPRPGDFCYDDEEVAVMAFDAASLVQDGGADGVVFGGLDKKGDIDKQCCSTIMQSISNLKDISTTFHRAFDATRDPVASAEVIAGLGFDRILTSGQQNTALEGKELLRTLATAFTGRIKFLPGGGVSENNLKELRDHLDGVVQEFHASAKVKQSSTIEFRNEKVRMGPGSDDHAIYVASKDRVLKMVSILAQK